MKKNLFETVAEVLKSNSKYVAEDGNLLKAVVYSDVMNMKKELLGLLLSNETIKEKFFEDVNGVLVFDKQKFAWFLESKEFLPDSYTRYTNKIGLTHNGDFISKSNDVVLDFPYKDCVLRGGQDKDDQKRKEIFYNEIVASDEVTKMLAPKVFTKAKRYTSEGVEENITFDDNDNLIIKGNNLIALSSLLKRYEGKIKCIYIDPPYYFSANKAEDSFLYNSNFKLSTWLTFMKNRLEIAKRLLSDDGAIFVQISDDGVAELHLLLKEVFNDSGNNFLNKITIKTKSPSGFASVNAGVFETAEYVISYAKNKKLWKYNPQYVETEYDPNYKWYVKNKSEDYTRWEIVSVGDYIAQQMGYLNRTDALKVIEKKVFIDMEAEFSLKNNTSVFQSTAIGNDAGQKVVEARNQSKLNRNVVYEVQRENQYTVYVYNGREMAFYNKKIRVVDGKEVPTIQLSNIWTDTPYEGIASEGGVTLKGGKKPEKLLKRIIELATDEGDIVLDYHLGSGTTCAVANKLNRKFIGIEQLDYINSMTVNRIHNVIKGEQTGISKSVNWQGGGSFVYCELLENAQSLVEQILAANEDNIHKVKDAIYSDERIIPYITRKELADASHEFEALPLEEKKQVLIRLVDKNKLYVNYSDMEDTTFDVSEADKQFTQSFYKEF